jgi:Fe-S oxidoreductase
VELGRSPFRTPSREGLPPLDRYAQLALGEERRLAGYVEASHGCLHRCRHCPVPVVYDGRLRIVPEDVVLADAEAQVAAGARHITFGDPDFLNGPQHSLRVVRRLHERFPDVTFDCTAKVDHILRGADLWPELAAAGCLFVVSAFESVDDTVLVRLDKGHTTAQASEVVWLLRRHGVEVRPSFLPFTPWTTLDDMVALIDFVAAHDLVGNVEPVQYTIRLLLPQGSLLLSEPSLAGRLGPYDPERLTWTWTSADPAVDRLQRDLAALVEADLHAGEPLLATYRRVRAAIHRAAGRDGALAPELAPLAAGDARPRLTEPWFC